VFNRFHVAENITLCYGKTMQPVIAAEFINTPFFKTKRNFRSKAFYWFIQPFGGDFSDSLVEVTNYSVQIDTKNKTAVIHVLPH
jgi:hypothetical protein